MMDVRQLGQTGLLVSRMGVGLAALGRPGYINLGHAQDLRSQYDVATMQAAAHAVLDIAWAGGVRYFDAARSYGRAEEFLAAWLAQRHIAPDTVTVGSKWGYTYTAGWRVDATHHEVKDHSRAVLTRQLAESRRWFGAHLDLYQIHSATLDSGVLERDDVLAELAGLRATGAKVGLTLTGPRQAETLEKAMAVRVGQQRLFDTVQATWNLLEQSAGAALQAAHRAGMGVIVKEALANGRLTPRNDDPAFVPKRQVLEETAARRQTTVDALALAAVLAQPWVDVVLSGAATVAQLQSNLSAFQVAWDDDSAERLAGLVERPDVYWQTRSALAWN